MNTLNIHDIKALSEVSDFSLYVFILLLLCSLGLFVFLIYFIVKKIKNKKINIQKTYIQTLKTIDMSQSKNAAYLISKYAHLLNKDENQNKLANELIFDLQKYKYKKQSNTFNDQTKILIKNFMESI